MLPRNSPELRRWVVEAFAAGNLAFLAVDIWFAHSMNHFAFKAEWIPFAFSVVAPFLLLPGLLSGNPSAGIAKMLGWFVGATSVIIGIAGLILHLHGTFFIEQTMHNLVYTAPFAAPLSYAGLGFLLILGRTESPASPGYGQWVTFLGAGGFAGNFALTLADHAQNGFFYASEWLAVLAASFGFAFLIVAAWAYRDRACLKACAWVLLAQVVVGMIGAGLHVSAILAGPSESLLSNAIHTAPLFAPLLFVDLALLGGLGLWCSWSIATSAPVEGSAQLSSHHFYSKP
ncbi:MAG: hypothetical protein ACI8TQ_002269 [Planctomycetota bacterium]